MAKISKEQQLFEMLSPIVEEAGYECVDVTFEKNGPDWILTAFIDCPEGVSLDDCEKVSRIIDPFLDEKDPIDQSYFLEVSSPGIDRPLKRDRDYEKAVGKKITVSLFVKRDGSKEFTGILKEAGPETIVLDTGNGEICFTRKEISKAAPVIEF
ncbi:MAG: ribosome maturation factor RimP [Eubacteriaceae bacterium]|jgi:ribosome maturation factor RimP